MKRNTFNNLGGLQSLFFCAGVYTVALFFAIFVCSCVFYAFNPKKQSAIQAKAPVERAVYASIP